MPHARSTAMAKRILVVEDDLLNRMFYQAALENAGYEVETVSDGAFAIEAVHRFAPDLITMDVQLPNLSGVELTRRLQRDPATQPIPILAITAFAGKYEEKRLRDAGAKGYLAKPVSIAQLTRAIERLLVPAVPE